MRPGFSRLGPGYRYREYAPYRYVEIEEHAPFANAKPAQPFAVRQPLYVTFAGLTIPREGK